MADALVVFGTNRRGPVLDSNFSSQTVSAGNTSGPCPVDKNYVSITAVTGNVYVAFANSSSNTANASADPRVWIPAGGTLSFSVSANTKVSVVNG